MKRRFCLWALLLVAFAARAEIRLDDDGGTLLRLAQPAQRIVSLAPHITEVLFAAGAGARVVGTTEYSDYPEAALKIPRVGGYSRLDLEAVAALRPDLVIAWQSGNVPAHVDKLRKLGLAVFVSQPDRIDDIARTIETYGRLAGTDATAATAAREFRERLARLRAAYGGREPLRVFYQVWKQPLRTINGRQIISDAIRLCGGSNVFAGLDGLAPNVSTEAVIAANPDVIIASGMGDSRPEWLDDWRRWTQVTAVAREDLYFVPPQLIQRHTPRFLEGTEIICRHLDAVRAKRRPR